MCHFENLVFNTLTVGGSNSFLSNEYKCQSWQQRVQQKQTKKKTRRRKENWISSCQKDHSVFLIFPSLTLTRLRLVFHITPLRLKRNLIFCEKSWNVFFYSILFDLPLSCSFYLWLFSDNINNYWKIISAKHRFPVYIKCYCNI